MQSSFRLFSEGTSATVELLHAIARFLKQYEPLWRAHVVEFFHDRLWEHVDAEWWEDLKSASIQDLLWLPSGVVQENWCSSLKDFVRTAQSLSLHRQPVGNFEEVFPGFSKWTKSSVLSQGMNLKKQHEVEVLSAVIASLMQTVDATHVLDVGAGQGYLAQVLAFAYGLHVVALDTCTHHADVTNARSGRIKKYYMARGRKSIIDCKDIIGPQTVTFHVVPGSSKEDLHSLISTLAPKISMSPKPKEGSANNRSSFQGQLLSRPHSFILAGLHACGDLSAAMLRAFVVCDEVKAIATVGCCYNLLSEDDNETQSSCSIFGFPLSRAAKELGLNLGRRARDLACQSADRWRDIGPESASYNFEQHALRAAFQLVLHQYYPELAATNPSVGRLGKTRRRKQVKRYSMLKMVNNLDIEPKPSSHEVTCKNANLNGENCLPTKDRGVSTETDPQLDNVTTNISLKLESQVNRCESSRKKDFLEFTNAACKRLDLAGISQEDLEQIWEGIDPQVKLIGPFWSLRAVLGPVLETYILLDRLLFLQEQLHTPSATVYGEGNQVLKPRLFALFDPELSPRNMAIIAVKESKMDRSKC